MSQNKLEMSVLDDAVNSPVIQFPGRRFPGVLVQGDSLKSMANLGAEIGEHLRLGEIEEAMSVAEDLSAMLRSRVSMYEEALKAHGLTLPYSSAEGKCDESRNVDAERG
jgi:hypothetical protein